MKAIVTGATGFIGTALCEELLQHENEVIAVIRPDSKKREKLSFLEEKYSGFRIIDVALDDLVSLSGKIERAEVFYHLAWNGAGGKKREDFDIQYTNIKYTADAVRVAVKCGCHKFVGAGSQAEYGVVSGMAQEEATVPHPFMMYGAAKLAAYQMAQVLAKQLGITLIWPRIYSVYGVGENEGTLLNYLIDCLEKNVRAELSACDNLWDFMYITDCVRALRMLGETENTKGIYNISAGNSRRLREYVEEVRELVNPTSEIIFGAKQSDPEKTFQLNADVSRIRDIGFSSLISFEEGIKRKIGQVK